MKALEMWIVDYILNSVWQIPLIFAAAWLAARLVRPAGPRLEHRVWVGAVLAEAILPACHFAIGDGLREIWGQFVELIQTGIGGGTAAAHARVVLGPGTVVGAGFSLPAWLIAAITAAYSCVLLYCAVRLVWGLFRTSAMLRKAEPVPAAVRFTGALGESGIAMAGGDSVQILISSAIAGPVTLGIRSRALLLPEGFLDSVSERDLRAVLAHEFAHIERRDFAKNLLYGIISLPAIYNPALWLTIARLAETREMVCDEIAAEAVAGKEVYARSLLRLASMLVGPMPVRTLHAIGIFDANSFERRVMNLTQKRPIVRGVRRFALVAACVVVALGACASALALRFDFTASATENAPPQKLHVGVKDLKIVSKVQPVYPVKAKEEKNTINGAVILTATIGKDGAVEHLAVKQSLRDDYDQSAMDAVRLWRYEPYLLNGDPVEVETEVTIIYSIEK
jgi:TonB family protein